MSAEKNNLNGAAPSRFDDPVEHARRHLDPKLTPYAPRLEHEKLPDGSSRTVAVLTRIDQTFLVVGAPEMVVLLQRSARALAEHAPHAPDAQSLRGELEAWIRQVAPWTSDL